MCKFRWFNKCVKIFVTLGIRQKCFFFIVCLFSALFVTLFIVSLMFAELIFDGLHRFWVVLEYLVFFGYLIVGSNVCMFCE